MSGFPVTFAPAAQAVRLLAEIAKDASQPYAFHAGVVLNNWRGALATPAQIAMVETGDELEIDSNGACVSEADEGFWIQTWSWVAPPETDEPAA